MQGHPDALAMLRRAQDWLVSIQHEDGGWGLNGLDQRSSWHTAWAVLALAGLVAAADSVQRGRDWLSAVPVYRETDDDLVQAFNQDLHLDVRLTGWPWIPTEASWIQPSSLAMLALRGALPAAQERLAGAVLYLENRRVLGGGWNIGNPAMFEGVLPAHATPTSLAILALKEVAPLSIQTADLILLRQCALEDGGPKALAWAILGLRTMGDDVTELKGQLLAAQQADGAGRPAPLPPRWCSWGWMGAL